MENNTPVVNNNNPYQSPGAPTYPSVMKEKVKRTFSGRENLFAWVCFILSYLFCLAIPIHKNPFGAFVVIVLMFVSTFAVLMVKGKKLQFMPLLVAVSAVAVSSCLIITANGFLRFFAFVYALVAYCYFLYAMSGDNRFYFADRMLLDFVKAVFVLPFYSLGDIFVAMFSGKTNKSGRFVLKLLVGAVIAIAPTAIVLSLLSYDSDFSGLMDRIFSFDNFSILEHIGALIFAIPVGAYVYGLFISAKDNKCNDMLTPLSCKKTMSTLKIAPVVTVLTAVIPVLFVYVVFFVSQWQYYVSAFTNVLPKDFSYAQYAREGFFQLCTVSVINLVILIVISLFLKQKDDKPSVVFRLLAVIISVFTLVLISTAAAKMIMYIDCYGLTPKRVYASWMILVLAVVFLLIIVKQFVSKLRLIALSLAVLVVLFSALALSNVDTIIAGYNVDRYLDGTLDTVDIDAMHELGDAAIPELVRLANILDKNNNTDIATAKLDEKSDKLYYDLVTLLRDEAAQLRVADDNNEGKDIWSFTVPSTKAEQALRSTTLLD